MAASCGEYVPAVQLLQPAAPANGPYEPGAHFSQGVPPGVNCPAWHVMSQLVAASLEDFPAEQSVQGALPLCPNVPAVQDTEVGDVVGAEEGAEDGAEEGAEDGAEVAVQVYEYAGSVIVPS